ncbi:hypothetical protein [Agromyces laixinhei]|uniref:hypothetical protein n=1 Tax=Agromyces laixinhei TaxID=2585717 RepID=UPI0011170B65|nr:hypothetical protein [Agromyces laixinhei]
MQTPGQSRQKMNGFSISRRQLIVGAAGVVAATVVWDQSGGRVEAATLSDAITSENRQTIEFFSADFTVKHVWQLATVIAISTLPERVQTVSAEFLSDPRVLAQRRFLSVQNADGLTTVKADDTSLDGSTASVIFNLDRRSLSGEQVRIYLPLLGRMLYPEDGIDGVSAPIVKLALMDADGKVVQRLERRLILESIVQVAPWGLVPSAGWAALTNPEQNVFYRVPVAINLRSIGPNPTPSGVQVEITVDQAQAGMPVVTSLASGPEQLDPTLITVSAPATGLAHTVVLTINEAMPVGASHVIGLSWPNADPQIAEPSPQRSAVTILTEGTQDAPRRRVGNAETLSDDPNRLDTKNIAAKEGQ